MSSKNFIHSKIFQSDRIQRGYREKFTAHCTYRFELDLNLTLVAAANERFIFQIIDSYFFLFLLNNNILDVIKSGFTPVLQVMLGKQEDCHHGNPAGYCFDLHWL